MLAACDGCGKKFDVTGKRAGAKFRCPTCKQGMIEVPAAAAPAAADLPELPDLPEMEELEPVATSPPPKASPRTARAPASRPHAGARAHAARAAAAPKKSGAPLPLLIGIGAVVIGAAAFFFLRGDKGGATKPAQSGTQPSSASNAPNAPNAPNAAGPSNAPAAPPAGSQVPLADRRKALAKGDAKGRAALAAQAASEGQAAEAKSLNREALLIDPDEPTARASLGFVRYDGVATRFRGRWLDKTDLELAKKAEKFTDGSGLKASADSATAFLRQCEEVKHSMLEEFPEDGWLYCYGAAQMPQPFFVVIQRKGDAKTLDGYRAEDAEILTALYDAFYQRYQERFHLDVIERPVKVIVFDGLVAYKDHRAKHPEGKYLDPDLGVLGYYQGEKQRLIMWRQKDLESVLFHEGTHMFVHYAFSGKGFDTANQSPWFQEGLAEYFAGHKTAKKGTTRTFTLGQFLPGRYGQYRFHASTGTLMHVRDLVKMHQYDFQNALNNTDPAKLIEAQKLVGNVYAGGWVFIMYLNTAEGGKYAKIFDDYFEAETKGMGDYAMLAELLGLKSDDDWDDLDQKVREWAVKELPKLQQ